MKRAKTLLILLAALFVSSAFAEGDGIAFMALKPRVAAGVAISCAHFRARLRSQMETGDQAFWFADPNAAQEELRDYFANRMAANPYDVAAQSIADVTWAVSKAEYPDGGQITAISELARDDFDGGQTKFTVAGRSVVRKSDTVEIRSPVRMADVCINGYIDLKVLSECPVDDFEFWRPDLAEKPRLTTVMVTECKKTQTLRLSLSGVDDALNAGKHQMKRANAPLSLPIDIDGSPACDGETAKAANLLENLRNIRQVHNCEIDVVQHLNSDQVEYSLFARDIFACRSSLYGCLETELSLTVPAKCLNQPASVSPSLKFVSGVNFTGGNSTAELGAQVNRLGQLMSLSVSHLNRKNGNFIDRVICSPNVHRRNL